MKKLLVILLTFGLVSSASAQFHGRGGGHFGGHTTVVVGGGYSPFYSSGLYFGLPWGYPGYGYDYGYGRPSKLDMQIEDIKHDYADRIASVKMDKSVPRKERRRNIRQLKKERDDAVYDAKRNYYKH